MTNDTTTNIQRFERNPQPWVLFLFDNMGVSEGELLNAQ